MFNLASQLENLKALIIRAVLLGGTLLIGFVWLSIGLAALLKEALGAVWGPIVMGTVFILPAVIYGIMQAFAPKKPAKPQGFAADGAGDHSVLAISKMIDAMSGISPVATAIVAVGAGFMMTRFPSLLNIFAQLVTAFADDVKARKAKKDAEDAAKEAQRQKAATPPPPPDIE
jgi:hypothetical protein